MTHRTCIISIKKYEEGVYMKLNEYFNTSESYNYTMDLSKLSYDINDCKSKKKASLKRYICIDLEMTEFTTEKNYMISGTKGEVIQFGAVMLDENFNMISKFSSYVKPQYSSVTPLIHQLTGISNKALENADDFITVFDKFSCWRGEGDITTFCWSNSDHKQLWNELIAKGSHRYDLFGILKDFVDLQKIFVTLTSSKALISLEAALKLLKMEYEGQVHNAYSDSFNTARILHKLFCTDSLDFEYEYINPGIENAEKDKSKEDAFENCTFANFISPELLARFGLTKEESEDDTGKSISVEDNDEIDETLMGDYINDKEINCLCEKYKISFKDWVNLIQKVIQTEEMLVA